MEADVIADALEDDALQIVVEDGAGHALERGEGLDVPAQEALERLVEGEARVAGARPRQHEHEAREEPGGGADADRAEVAPVDLGLLAGERLEAQVGLGAGGGPDGADVAAAPGWPSPGSRARAPWPTGASRAGADTARASR